MIQFYSFSQKPIRILKTKNLNILIQKKTHLPIGYDKSEFSPVFLIWEGRCTLILHLSNNKVKVQISGTQYTDICIYTSKNTVKLFFFLSKPNGKGGSRRPMYG